VISFTYAQLSAYLAAFLWPLARVAALISAAPVLGSTGIPLRVRVLLALAVTVAVAPLAGPMPQIDPWSAAGVAVLAQQMLIGASMGFSIRIVFSIVDLAGEVSGLQMGLGFATFFDPQHGTQVPVVAQFLGLLTTLVFLAIDGHLMMFSALADSFRALPIGSQRLDPEAWHTIAGWGGRVLADGALLALPVVTALLITNAALGLLTRAAPQLNLFAIGFPVTIMVGWLMLMLSLPLLAPLLTQLFEQGLRLMPVATLRGS
jgi:flagellar biosynthetic protein FliR